MAPSRFCWKSSYAFGASLSGRWCVASPSTPSGSSSPVRSGKMSPTQRLTLAWPMRTVICLSNSVIIGSGSTMPPYTPTIESVPPRRTVSIAACSTDSRSTPAFSISFCRDRVGQEAREVLGELAERRAMRLHADRVDHGIRAASIRQSPRSRPRCRRVRAGRAPRCRDVRASASRSGTRSMPKTRPAPRCSATRAGHLADRPEAVDGDGAASRHRPRTRRPATRSAARPRGRRSDRRPDPPARRSARIAPRVPAGTRPGHPAPGRRASCSRTAPRPCPARAPASSRTATAGRGRTCGSARTRC